MWCGITRCPKLVSVRLFHGEEEISCFTLTPELTREVLNGGDVAGFFGGYDSSGPYMTRGSFWIGADKYDVDIEKAATAIARTYERMADEKGIYMESRGVCDVDREVAKACAKAWGLKARS